MGVFLAEKGVEKKWADVNASQERNRREKNEERKIREGEELPSIWKMEGARVKMEGGGNK